MRKGAVGVGTLIVFIAMILVAAVAAAVLINTSGFLQQKSQSTGRETTQEVASGIRVMSVVGYTPDRLGITKLAIYVTPNAGSSGIDLSQTRVILSTEEKQAVLFYRVGSENSVKISGDSGSITLTPASHTITVKYEDSNGDGTADTIVFIHGSEQASFTVSGGKITINADGAVTLTPSSGSGSLTLTTGSNTVSVSYSNSALEIGSMSVNLASTVAVTQQLTLYANVTLVALSNDASLTPNITISSAGTPVTLTYYDTDGDGVGDVLQISNSTNAINFTLSHQSGSIYTISVYANDTVSISTGTAGEDLKLSSTNSNTIYANYSYGVSGAQNNTKLDEDSNFGSPVTFNLASVTSLTQDVSAALGVAYTGSSEDKSDIFSESLAAWNALDSHDFGIIVVQDSDGSVKEDHPTLNKGDIVVLTVRVDKVFGAGIPPRTKIIGKIIPEFGAPGVIEFTTPTTYTNNIITLQ